MPDYGKEGYAAVGLENNKKSNYLKIISLVFAAVLLIVVLFAFWISFSAGPKSQVNLELTSAYILPGNMSALIEVSRGSGAGEVTRLRFIFQDLAGKNYSYEYTNVADIPLENQSKIYNITIDSEANNLGLVSFADIILVYLSYDEKMSNGQMVTRQTVSSGNLTLGINNTNLNPDVNNSGNWTAPPTPSSGGPGNNDNPPVVTCTDTCTGKCGINLICGASVSCGVCACQASNSTFNYSCSSGDVYWFDNCGNRTSIKQDCSDGCYDNSCVIIGLNTFYVSVTGNGSHNGSVGNEMNLSDAINYSNANTNTEITFLIRDGGYGEFSLNNAPARASGKWVTWKAVNKLGANFSNIYISGTDVNAYLRFDGLNVLLPVQPTCLYHGNSFKIVYFEGISYIQILNSKINSTRIFNAEMGIWFSGVSNSDSHDLLVKNNEITNAGYGIRFNGYKINIINNTLHRLQSTGIGAASPNHISSIGGVNGAWEVIIDSNQIYELSDFPDESCYNEGQWYDMHASSVSVRGYNYTITNNRINNNRVGIQLYQDGGYDYDLYDINISNNLIYDIDFSYSLYNPGAIDGKITIEKNTIIGQERVDALSTSDPLLYRFDQTLSISLDKNLTYNGLGTIVKDNIILSNFYIGSANYQNYNDSGANWKVENNIIYTRGWNMGNLNSSNKFIYSEINAGNLAEDYIDNGLFVNAKYSVMGAPHGKICFPGGECDFTPKVGSSACSPQGIITRGHLAGQACAGIELPILENTNCSSQDVLCVDNDNSTGDAEYLTIQEAVNAVQPGQTVLVKNGTYNEQIDIQRYVGVNGNETDQITIKNYPGERPYLKGNKYVGSWKRCDTSCNALRDINDEINPLYNQIFYTDIAILDYTSNIPQLYELGIPLEIAIDPDQSDPYLEDVLEFTPLNASENIEFHGLVQINTVDNSIKFQDPSGEYAPLFKQGQEIIVSNKTNPYNPNNGSFSYILRQNGVYNGDGTTTLFVNSTVVLVDLTIYGLENTRFIRDSDLKDVRGYWNGSTIDFWTHGANNVIIIRKVFDYQPGKIVFDVPLLRFVSFQGSAPDGYALKNHPKAIDKKGEYIYSANSTHYRIYLYPKNEADLEIGIDAPKYAVGFYIYPNYSATPTGSWGNYITFSGFEIGFYEDRCIFQREGIAKKIIAENNYVHDCGEGIGFQWCLNCKINNNKVINTFTGFGIVAQGENVTVANNFVDNIRRTLIIPAGKNIALINNTMGGGGSHSNGMAIYEGNLNILVMGNRFMGPVGLTFERCENVTVYNNIIENAGVSDWGDSKNFYFYNNFIGGGIDFDATSGVARNNFASWFSPNLQKSNNIGLLEIDRSKSFRNTYSIRGHTNDVEITKMTGRGENINSNWTCTREDYTGLINITDYIIFSDQMLRRVTRVEGAIYDGNWITKISFNPPIESLEQSFQIWKYAPASFDVDYRYKENGTGIDNGTEIVFPGYLNSGFFAQFDLNADHEGNPRPSGSAWDIGPYEYQSANLSPPISGQVQSSSVWARIVNFLTGNAILTGNAVSGKNENNTNSYVSVILILALAAFVLALLLARRKVKARNNIKNKKIKKSRKGKR